MTRYFTFIGVTTGQSAVMKIFPRWTDVLGVGSDVQIVGQDLPLHAPPERYREVVQAIKSDPQSLGGLVTTHKVDLYHAARDLFDEVDDYARLLEETSCIARRDGRLLGWATDPISAGRSLQSMLEPAYFSRTAAHVLCLGAGGAALAIELYLLCERAGDRPGRLVLTSRTQDRLDQAQALHRQVESNVPLECVLTPRGGTNDDLVDRMPPHSLIINATGMGKDTPGSPLSDAVRFPHGAIAWDLNYRGELDFLRQARQQPASLDVRIEDGWDYFIHGWAAVMEQVFDREITPAQLAAMAEAAAPVRPSHVASDRIAGSRV